jgi:hypothetical protein
MLEKTNHQRQPQQGSGPQEVMSRGTLHVTLELLDNYKFQHQQLRAHQQSVSSTGAGASSAERTTAASSNGTGAPGGE